MIDPHGITDPQAVREMMHLDRRIDDTNEALHQLAMRVVQLETLIRRDRECPEPANSAETTSDPD